VLWSSAIYLRYAFATPECYPSRDGRGTGKPGESMVRVLGWVSWIQHHVFGAYDIVELVVGGFISL